MWEKVTANCENNRQQCNEVEIKRQILLVDEKVSRILVVK